MDYDNNLKGALFKNDNKEKDTQPDYKGTCEIEGVEFWLSAWINEGKKGKYMSLSFSPKEEEKPQAKKKQQVPLEEMDDDIPF